MARQRFLKPFIAYLISRASTRALDHSPTIAAHVTHAMRRRDGLLVTSIGPDGVRSIGYHTGEPNDLAQTVKVLHGEYSNAHRQAHGERAPWRHDHYKDTALHTDEVVLDALHDLLFAPGALPLLFGRIPFTGENVVLLRPWLEQLHIEARAIERFFDAVQRTFANPQQPSASCHAPRPLPRMTLAEFRAREAYRVEKAAAIARYVEAAAAWRAGDRSAVIPPEMFAPHMLASGDMEMEIPTLVAPYPPRE